MVVLVLTLAVAITAYVGWLMWNAPESAPSSSAMRRAQMRTMKRRLAAAMHNRTGEASAQLSFRRLQRP